MREAVKSGLLYLLTSLIAVCGVLFGHYVVKPLSFGPWRENGTMSTRVVGVILLFSAVVAASSPAEEEERAPDIPLPKPTSEAATIPFEQLKEGIKQHYKEFWAFEIEYETRQYGVGLPFGKHHFAVKGEKRLLNQSGVDTRDYSFGLAYDGEIVESYQPNLKAAVVHKKKNPAMDYDTYAEAMGIPVADTDRALVSKVAKLLMPSVLDMSRLGWGVHPTLESVEQVPCHVLVCRTEMKYRLCIDPKLGYATRFREDYQSVPGLPEAEWPLLARYFFSDFEKTQGGVYMAKKVLRHESLGKEDEM